MVIYPVLTKTAVINITNGLDNFLGVRSIEFYNGANLIELTPGVNCVIYASSQVTGYEAINAFDTSLSKTGTDLHTSWRSANYRPGRLVCVFNESVEISGIVINNWHNSGDFNDRSIGTADIHLLENEYVNSTPNATLTGVYETVFSGDIRPHTAVDEIDDIELFLIDSDQVAITFSGTTTKNGSPVSRELFFYFDNDLTTSLGSVTSDETTGEWSIDIYNLIAGDLLTIVCNAGAETEQSKIFNAVVV